MGVRLDLVKRTAASCQQVRKSLKQTKQRLSEKESKTNRLSVDSQKEGGEQSA
jgi:hypothetical protein